MHYETIEHLKETDFKRLTGVQRETFGQIENENFITQLRTKLGDTAFEEAWASGQSMSLEKTVSLAVGKIENK